MTIKQENLLTLATEAGARANNWADCDVIQEAIDQCRTAKTEEDGSDALEYLHVSVNYRRDLIPDKKDLALIEKYKQEFALSMMRKKYLAGNVSHREYYASIAKTAGYVLPANNHLVNVCRDAQDKEHYNNTGLSLGAFEVRSDAISKAFEAHGDFWSQAGSVCLTKEAIKQALIA